MNPLLRPVYAGGAKLAQAVAPTIAAIKLNSFSNNKLVRSLSARSGLIEKWEQQAVKVRNRNRQLVWIHAPSVGEGLQARPVAHAIRKAHPELQLAYTWFSPSAEHFGQTIGADLCGYLPFDTADAAERMLDALSPQVLVFAKLDIWPVLVERAHARGVKVALISGTVAPGSGRRSRLAHALLSDAYNSLAAVGAIDSANAERLVELGARAQVVQVTGDTRFDQVHERAAAFSNSSPIIAPLVSSRPTVVAGSTWPADETVLFSAWTQVVKQVPSARLVIAPHEPTTESISRITNWAANAGLKSACLGELVKAPIRSPVERPVKPLVESPVEPLTVPTVESTDVIIVDRVGVLGDIYGIADVAFVGGGFHRAGLHSVIEPAAFGVPVVFGPLHSMSREAGLLLQNGAARSGGREVIESSLREWLTNESARKLAGDNAKNVVVSELGATQRSLALVTALLAQG